MDATFRRWSEGELVWLPTKGMGWLEVTEQPYDLLYWRKYQRYAASELGRALTRERLRLVGRWCPGGVLVDVGIGCGQFVESRQPFAPTFGYDINPVGVEWLRERGLWLDPYKTEVRAASFWDALEHIKDATRLLANVEEWVFVSLPLVPGNGPPPPDWKHLRKDEHCLYWTRDGFLAWMAEQGFICKEHNTAESLLGRDDIHSFAFLRTRYPEAP